MERLAITLLVVCTCVTASAQLYRGTVYNAVTKNAVTGVSVTLQSTGAVAETDTNGMFVFWDSTGTVRGSSGDASSWFGPILTGTGVYVPQDAVPRLTVSTITGCPCAVPVEADGRLVLPGISGILCIAVDNRPVCRVLVRDDRGVALSSVERTVTEQRTRTLPRAAAAASPDTLVLSRTGYLASAYAVNGTADTLDLYIEREFDVPLFSDFTDGTVDRGYFPYVDDETWQISTYCCGTGGNHFMLENCVFTDTVAGDAGGGYLHMTVQANTTNGAEIWSTMKTHYGFYETRLKTSDIAGACNAFFLHDWNNGHIGEEVDLEFLTGDYDGIEDYGNVMCMLHPNGGGGGRTLPFNPGTGFHRYGWLWTPDSLCWLADGEIIQTVRDTALIPDGYVQMVYNNWTGNANWGGGPPLADNTMVIDWCRYYPDADTVVPLEY